jgi:hypothetical protein
MRGRGRFDGRVVVLAAMVAAVLSALLGASPAAAASLSWSAPIKVDRPHGQLNSLSCASPSFCVAVDLGGNALTFNGRSWSKPVRIDPEVSFGPIGSSGPAGLSVSCPVRTFCVAVDEHGRALTYSGHSWGAPALIDDGAKNPELESVTGQPTYVGLRDISCPSASFCIAVDDSGRTLTYAGRLWGAPLSPSPSGGGGPVSCASPVFCARAYANDVQVYRGGSWGAPEEVVATTPRSSERGTFDDVSCPSPSFCAAVGHASGGSTLVGDVGGPATYNGHSWSRMRFLDATGPFKGRMAVSCPTPSFCVATDGDGKALTYSGHSWSKPVTIDRNHEPVVVSCPTPSFCVAVDNDGRALYGTVKGRGRSKGKGHKHRSHR